MCLYIISLSTMTAFVFFRYATGIKIALEKSGTGGDVYPTDPLKLQIAKIMIYDVELDRQSRLLEGMHSYPKLHCQMS